jgi:hypothetical protein
MLFGAILSSGTEAAAAWGAIGLCMMILALPLGLRALNSTASDGLKALVKLALLIPGFIYGVCVLYAIAINAV